MFKAPDSPFLVPFDGSFRIDDSYTDVPDEPRPKKKELKNSLAELVDELDELQRMLYAQNEHAVLLIFQAMDAAGKDSTIRAVMSGVNPAGCQVYSFKKPAPEELDHDFLWRTAKRLPERGRIGIFNRSYYEEVLVVRVHPKILQFQNLPDLPDEGAIWKQRYASIRTHEEHLARNGTVILKFFLNVSREEQRQRFLARIDRPEKNWKFAAGDVKEREHWDEYMEAYEDALNATSRKFAPWYSIPADSKPYMRLTVARIVRDALESLGLSYPQVTDAQREELQKMRGMLDND